MLLPCMCLATSKSFEPQSKTAPSENVAPHTILPSFLDRRTRREHKRATNPGRPHMARRTTRDTLMNPISMCSCTCNEPSRLPKFDEIQPLRLLAHSKRMACWIHAKWAPTGRLGSGARPSRYFLLIKSFVFASSNRQHNAHVYFLSSMCLKAAPTAERGSAPRWRTALKAIYATVGKRKSSPWMARNSRDVTEVPGLLSAPKNPRSTGHTA